MRRLVQIAVLCAVVILLVFLAPTLHFEAPIHRSYETDVTECSLTYYAFEVGLNHRYTYISLSNGSRVISWDWGWRLDSSTTVSTRPSKHGVVNGTGTVEYVDVEGGFYGIVGDDGEGYDPYGSLPQEFAVDGLRVSFSVRICEGCGGFHMWGYIVDVISIQKLP